MIVVDTSALVAIVLGEPSASDCYQILTDELEILISAATASEAMIVSHRRSIANEMRDLFTRLGFQIAALTADDIGKVENAYRRWGKGFHPAGLNFGDCFAYALAHERGCPLLFVGNDFARTDVVSAL